MDSTWRAVGQDKKGDVRVRITIRGAVQGVGFRPFVFRLAKEMALAGWVNNSSQGVSIEAEGSKAELEEMLERLVAEKPPQCFIHNLETSWLDAAGYDRFEIRQSERGGETRALVMPDIATCAECLAEIFDPQNRRHAYPFTNCTQCGPRFSIIEALPYDRANTSMKRFTMCPKCQAEYDNPEDRRFHAQPNACPVCGPRIELWNSEGMVLAGGANGRRANSFKSDAKLEFLQPEGCAPGLVAGGALAAAATALRSGQIVAVKGLGGFHLMAAAANDQAVRELRRRKYREEKPFAVMFPTLQAVRDVCEVSRVEERLLQSAEAPIVLLRRLQETGTAVSSTVAPGNPNLGVILPYTPLHHLLLAMLKFPVVATSGNLSDEPICTDEREALDRLKDIADLFLVHNRPIVRHVDDSIVRVMAGRELVLRRARGYAPLPIQLRSAECGMRNAAEPGEGIPGVGSVKDQVREEHSALDPVLAVGADLKNAVAVAIGPQVFISQHIGDLQTAQAYDAFRRVITDLQRLYDSPVSLVVADAHPDYLSSKFARDTGLPCTTVQHHVAHVLSCMAENELEPPVLGVSWDGTGYGLDGTVWGGEFFRVTDRGYERAAHFRQFRLPGGDQAVREPRRSALGLLFELFGEAAFDRAELETIRAFSSNETPALRTMLVQQFNSPLASSAGRLFDGVTSLMGLRQQTGFEGQAAMELEFLIGANPESAVYDLPLKETSGLAVLNWGPAIEAILSDIKQRVSPAAISARFHNTLVESVLVVARREGMDKVVLSGGCFQNRYLTERLIRRLSEEGFRPYWHQRIPPNDGGICLGQVVAARWRRV